MNIILSNRYYLILLLIMALLLAACNTGDQESDEGTLTAEDFGVAAAEDHEHESAAAAAEDHEHEEESVAATGDETQAAAAAEEGVLLDHHGQPIAEEVYEKVEQDGVAVEFTVEGFAGLGGRGTLLNSDVAEGAYAAIKFNITDAETGAPLAGQRPAAWMDPHAAEAEHAADESCKEQVETYLQGQLNAQAQVDFNGFFILGMNEDATISVIDPLANVGGMTQLYAMMLLKQPAEDWAISQDQGQVYMTMPGAGQVAVLSTASFQIDYDLDAGVQPVRVAFQPDQAYVWVGNDADRRADSGVTVIDPAVPEAVAFVETGRGHHELAFSADSRTVFVSNAAEGNVSIIDSGTLAVVDEVKVPGTPVALDVSAQGYLYVLDQEDGTVTVIDGETFEDVAEIETGRGAAALRFTPDGRWALVANPEQGSLTIIDGDRHSVTHVAQVSGAPDQISFSQNLAYLRARDAAQVVTIPLADIAADQELPLTSVPVGNYAPGDFPQLTSAGAITPAPDNAGVMIANPADGQIHYYVEGSTGALGSFEGHGRRPRAAMVVDRSLHEEAPGVYVGRVRIPQDGEYEVAFFMGDPLISHCFYFTAKPDPEMERTEVLAPPNLEVLSEYGPIKPGETLSLQVRLTNSASGEPLADVDDLTGLIGPVSGIWQNRLAAAPVGDGVYQLDITLDEPGLYNVFFFAPSLGAAADQMPRLAITVEAGS